MQLGYFEHSGEWLINSRQLTVRFKKRHEIGETS
jgi:hypothetical protein